MALGSESHNWVVPELELILSRRYCGLCLDGGFFGTGLHPISASPRSLIAYAQRAAKYLHAPVLRRVLHVLALHVSTATATGPAAQTEGFDRSKSAWRDDEEAVRAGLQVALGANLSRPGASCREALR